MPQTIRIKPETREKLERLANAEAITMTNLLDKLVDAYRRDRLLREANAAFAALKADPKVWEQEQNERRDWDATIADGLAEDE